jgi:uncharacterized iron-regulated membrane protein
MGENFLKSMSWLHTWLGVVLSGLLFAIFWMGSLSVFDREIDLWMAPMNRLPTISAPVSLDATARPVAEKLAPKSSQWTFVLPSDRDPTLRFTYRDAQKKNVSQRLNPMTGEVLPDAGTHAGTGFLYPFHYSLHISFMDIGKWLVGFAAMAMLVAIVSGVVIHKRIFRDFFTFRPKKNTQRATLDLHNLTGVLALPFHFVIALSGLIIFAIIYFPSGWQSAYDGNKKAFNREASEVYKRDKAKEPGTLGSLDAMIRQSKTIWGDGGEVAQVRVHYPADAKSYVEVRRATNDRVTLEPKLLYFDGVSGALLAQTEYKPVRNLQRFIAGMHRVQFQHWTLRWLYFLAGLSGCVMIATGLLVWLAARRVDHVKKGLAGVRVVEALAIGAVPGILLATCAFFIINRLLPLEVNFLGGTRADLEMWAFFSIWVLSFAHACWRGFLAWSEQCILLACFALVAVLLNWITTGDHLLRTLSNGSNSIASMDIVLLLAAVIAAYLAIRLRKLALQANVDKSEKDDD